MFGKYDISFCANQSCKNEKCMRHHSKIPIGIPVSVGAFMPRPDGKCEYRFDDDWETVDHPVEVMIHDPNA